MQHEKDVRIGTQTSQSDLRIPRPLPFQSVHGWQQDTRKRTDEEQSWAQAGSHFIRHRLLVPPNLTQQGTIARVITLASRQRHIRHMSRDKSSTIIAATVAAASVGIVVAGAAAALWAPLTRQRSRRRRWWSSQSTTDPCSLLPARLLESPFAKELQACVTLAHAAGQNMKGYLESKGTIHERDHVDAVLGSLSSKSNEADFCTKVDIENELLIIQGLQKIFPDYDIIGEESVGTGTIPRLDPNTPTFIIDPIDGTTNFSQGFWMTCVSIGLCVDGRPVMGVVYVPATEEWYLAISGYGAYRNGIALNVPSQDQDPQQQYPPIPRKTLLSQAVVCCEFGYSRQHDEIDAMVGAVARILQHGCRAIRQLGSGVLDLCYVATGRLDIVYAGIVNEGWKPWDYAAGLVICQEAGCIMESIHPHPTDPCGTDFDLYGKSVICGVSRELVDELRQVLLRS